MTAEGWHDGLPFADYLEIPAVSSTRLRDFRRSPQHYRYRLENPQGATPAQELGTLTHLAVLEPERFAAECAPPGPCEGYKGDGSRCGNPGKVDREEGGLYCGIHDPLKGKDAPPSLREILTEDRWEQIVGMRDALRGHAVARSLLYGAGHTERSGVFVDSTGVTCKIRPDRLVVRKGVPFHADLKTTSDASPDEFARLIPRLGYHMQAAFYRRGLQTLEWECQCTVLVAVEQKPPHGIGCYLLRESDLEKADEQITRELEHWKMCADDDDWPGYGEGLKDLALPPWTFPEEDGDDDE